MNKLTASVSKRFTLSYKIAVNEKVIFVGLIVFTPFFVIYFLNQPDFFVRAARVQFKIPFFLIFEYIFLLLWSSFCSFIMTRFCFLSQVYSGCKFTFSKIPNPFTQTKRVCHPHTFMHYTFVFVCVCVCTLILNIHVCVSASVLRLTASGRESALEVVGTTRIHTNTTRSIRSTWSARDRCSLSSEDPGEDDNNKNI